MFASLISFFCLCKSRAAYTYSIVNGISSSHNIKLWRMTRKNSRTRLVEDLKTSADRVHVPLEVLVVQRVHPLLEDPLCLVPVWPLREREHVVDELRNGLPYPAHQNVVGVLSELDYLVLCSVKYSGKVVVLHPVDERIDQVLWIRVLEGCHRLGPRLAGSYLVLEAHRVDDDSVNPHL